MESDEVKKKIEKNVFNIARDTLILHKHVHEPVFGGVCCVNQNEIKEELNAKFGSLYDFMEEALWNVAAIIIQMNISSTAGFFFMASSFNPLVVEGIQIPPGMLDLLVGDGMLNMWVVQPLSVGNSGAVWKDRNFEKMTGQ